MLVDVVPLWDRGKRRSKAEVDAAAPVRGLLRLDYAAPRWSMDTRKIPLYAGVTFLGSDRWALPILDMARVERIKDGNLYVAGIEEVEHYRRYVKYQQAWWCRLVSRDEVSQFTLSLIRRAGDRTHDSSG